MKINPSNGSRTFRDIPALGNIIILIVVAYVGSRELRLGQLILVGVLCLGIYNGILLLRRGTRFRESATGVVVEKDGFGVKNILATAIALFALFVFDVGVVLPIRLPAGQRDPGHQTIALLIAFAALFLAQRLSRNR